MGEGVKRNKLPVIRQISPGDVKYSMVLKKKGTSLVAQWLRIHLPMQGHGFEPWSRKIPHAVEQLTPAPQILSLCSRAREPQLLSPCATTTEACTPRARAPQQEKPLQ